MIVVRVGAAPRRTTRCSGAVSASRMIASSVWTARTGYAPAAVSPASMIASTPSSTAFAASLTSARVGRASTVIDSSTCVATITGIAARARAAGDFLLRPRHALERHLESEISARHHHRVAGVENLVEVVERQRPLQLGDRSARRRAPASAMIRARPLRRPRRSGQS